MDIGLIAGVVGIGLIHGVLPDHGWPIAATYALSRRQKFFYGTVAGLILGVGHLISSVVLVGAYFWVSQFAAFAESPWMRYIAGGLLILLGVREYLHGGHGMHDHGEGHDHGHDDQHNHDHSDHHGHNHDDDHAHDNEDHHDYDHDDDHGQADDDHHHNHEHHHDDHSHSSNTGFLARTRAAIPGVGGHQHLREEHAERGLAALGLTALLLGFAHEEPIQILAICVGTNRCLELMLVYSLAVIIAILVPTLLLIAGYENHRKTVEKYTPYLPTVTAVVLVAMGLAFIIGIV